MDRELERGKAKGSYTRAERLTVNLFGSPVKRMLLLWSELGVSRVKNVLVSLSGNTEDAASMHCDVLTFSWLPTRIVVTVN